VASPTILVTGAAGLNGGEVVRRLSAQGVLVRALVRSSSRAAALATQPNVEIVEGDMAQPATLAEALRGIERALLISSSDPTMLDVQSNFIEAASAAGVKHVVKLSGVAPEDAKSAQLAAGLPPYLVDALAELFAERRKGKESQVSPLVQTILEREATSFDTFARRNAAVFRGEPAPPKA
jgi:NAD(P)-dependent dehydrogenase (short-subunit alcohol dehydrogenase family)